MATVYKTGSTRNPAGLSIDRNGMEFTLTWKVMDNDYNGGLQIQWRTNYSTKGTWTNVSAVTTSDTSATVAINPSILYPANASRTLSKVTLRIRGKRAATTVTSGDVDTITNYNWSGWVEKNFLIYAPRTPSATQELSGTYPTAKFSWSVITDSTDQHPFSSVEWQSMLVKSCTTTDGSKLAWNSSKLGWTIGTGQDTGNWTKTEDSTTLADGSYTRWFRVRSRGVGGASPWRYTRHVYAKPYAATIDSNTKKTYARKSSTTTDVRVEWTSATNAARPIDYTEVQYVIGTPSAANLVAPVTGWNTGATIMDSVGTDIAQFVIEDQVGADEGLWVRVANFHDEDTNPSYSSVVLLMTGKLAAPSFSGSVSTDSSQRKATISFTNNSDVPDSRVAVVFYRGKNAGYICGIADHGDTSITVTNLLPWSSGQAISFGLFAFRGSYRSSGGWKEGYQYTVYTITDSRPMTSETVTNGGNVPVAPTGCAASQIDSDVLVKWNWNWNDATQAEVSWSSNRNAWQSTSEPNTYSVNVANAPQIRVSNLTAGTTWYFRVRFVSTLESSTAYGPYSSIMAVTVGSAPLKPTLSLSGTVVRNTTKVTASWSYLSTDGSGQSAAVLWECNASGTNIKQIGRASGAHYCTFQPKNLSWSTGSTHYVRLRVTSAAGLVSEWSDPVAIAVADPVTCTITQASLGAQYVIPLIYPADTLYPDSDVYPSNGRNGQYKLTAMPLTATITGAGAGGTTTLAIERLLDYQMERPDESIADGYAGETIALITQVGEAQITIDNDDLIGSLDDGAWYRLVATVQDGLGQANTKYRLFIVKWSHQAVMPEATASMDGNAAIITPTEPTGAAAGDYCDIYRLSADKPELIIRHAEFGEAYVDPYPAIGEHGGHRVVFRTANGDYITSRNRPAWIDLKKKNGDYLDSQNAIIDFNGDQIEVEYNVDLSSNWSKDFQETKYLGGAIQGDWNPGVSRTGSVSGATYAYNELDKIATMRRLAAYPGICHVRTPDGSSFSADIQVSESQSYSSGGKVANFTLNITRVDPEGLDGLTYNQWIGG